MKLIIAGSRYLEDYELVKFSVLNFLEINDIDLYTVKIVSGDAKGADALGERFAKEHDMPIQRFPADWDKFGRSAGPKRNKQMAEYATHLCAFWDGKSRGTGSMVKVAEAKGLTVHICELPIEHS